MLLIKIDPLQEIKDCDLETNISKQHMSLHSQLNN